MASELLAAALVVILGGTTTGFAVLGVALLRDRARRPLVEVIARGD